MDWFLQLIEVLNQFLPMQVAEGLAGLLVAAGLMIIIELVDLALRGKLDQYGVRPRDARGLAGILPAPLLHGGFGHLVTNIPPLLFLGALVSLAGPRVLIAVTAVSWLFAGLGAWVFGRRGSVHIGASGVVFGYLGFLFGRAIFEQSMVTLMIAVLAGLLYGSALWGVLPIKKGRSWQSHLFGLAGGFLAAWQILQLLES